MLLKAIFLSQVERANARFLADYHHLAANADAGALDQKESAEEEELDGTGFDHGGARGHAGKFGASTVGPPLSSWHS